MFERFTDRARTVVVMAQEEARGLGHNYIGTEHILLGLLAERNGVAAQVLEGAGISLDAIRADVERIIGRGVDIPTANIPFTPRAKKLLENSLREALRLGHNYIGTEHILLGVVSEGEGVAAQILVSHGLALDEARARVVDALGGAQRTIPFTIPRRLFVEPVVAEERLTPAGGAILAMARELAGPDPVASSHFLRAIVTVPDNVAARALASLGITREHVEGAVGATTAEGSSDETPDEVMARSVRIRAEDERVVIELSDPDLARLLTGFKDEPAMFAGGLAQLLQQVRSSLERAAREQEDAGGASMGE